MTGGDLGSLTGGTAVSAADGSTIPSAVTDPGYASQWHLGAVKAPEAWAYLESQGLTAGGSSNIVVAVIDTGVDYTRSEFGSCTAPGVPAGCRVVAALDTAPLSMSPFSVVRSMGWAMISE